MFSKELNAMLGETFNKILIDRWTRGVARTDEKDCPSPKQEPVTPTEHEAEQKEQP